MEGRQLNNLQQQITIMSETIYARLGEVMKAVGAIDKNRKNEVQKFNFRGIEDFMNELHTHMANAGVFIVPKELEHIQESFETTSVKNGQTETKLQFRTRIHCQFEFVSTEDGSKVIADGWGEAADNGDKGYNKCKSAALKYVLMQMFLVPTKDLEDADGESPEVASKKNLNDPDLELALQLVKEAKSVEELQKVWNDNAGYKNNTMFFNRVQERNRELSSNQGV